MGVLLVCDRFVKKASKCDYYPHQCLLGVSTQLTLSCASQSITLIIKRGELPSFSPKTGITHIHTYDSC